MKKPIVWSIGGHDPSGFAGITADLKTMHHLKVECLTIISACTAQNSKKVIDIGTQNNLLAQCNALFAEFSPDIIKVGMLGSTQNIQDLIKFLKNFSGIVILDPVLVSSSKHKLTSDNEYLKNLLKLITYCTIITPNIPEAEQLLGIKIHTQQDIEQAALQLIKLGVQNVILKGGHSSYQTYCQDFWSNGNDNFWLATTRHPSQNYRGSGCVFASAIAASLALGYCIKDAVVIAKMYISRAIRKAKACGPFAYQLYHQGLPKSFADLPMLSKSPLEIQRSRFIPCKLGLYPVVDSSNWVEKLLATGVKVIQLRIKDLTNYELAQEIQKSVRLARKYKATLFINDYWQLAIKYQADGVHLGQEDLDTADINAIHKAGLYLGISTHCFYEVAKAHALQPSYIACGPIYPTTSKIMPFKSQGLTNLRRWRQTLNYPMVAIGGIDLPKVAGVCRTGVEGVALISAITKSAKPIQSTQELLQEVSKYA